MPMRRVQLQYVAQVFAGQILGDDLASRPDPTYRGRSASDNGGHLRRLAPLPGPASVKPSPCHARCWVNQSSMSCHACSAASAL